MGFLDELPKPDQFTALLADVVGDDAQGVGVAGALRLLREANVDTLSGDLIERLEQTLDLNVEGKSEVITGALEPFQQAIALLPNDASALTGTLNQALDTLRRLAAAELPRALTGSISSLQQVLAVAPAEPSSLLQAASAQFDALKQQLITGGLGEIQEVCAQLAALESELPRGVAAGDAETALIGYLESQIAGALGVVLPAGDAPAELLSRQLAHAITSERVSQIEETKSKLVSQLTLARGELEGGSLTNWTHLNDAQASLERLTADLSEMHQHLISALNQELATPQGLSQALNEQVENLEEVEIVDLTNPQELFGKAFDELENTVMQLDPNQVRQPVQTLLTQVEQLLSKADPSQFSAQASEIQSQLAGVADGLNGSLYEAVAVIREAFTRIHEALRSIASAVGSYDEQGAFHFNVETELEKMLGDAQSVMQDSLQPILETFKESVKGTLERVHGALDNVQAQIEVVKGALQNALMGLSQKLQELDLPGKLDSLGTQLQGLLDQFGQVKFDMIVDPVVAQIDDMREQIKKIDLSSLNDFLRETLRTALQAVLDLDFPGQITAALMGEIDKIIQIPVEELAGVEEKLEGALQQFGTLAPEALLKPLDALFAPVSDLLDELQLDHLLEPVNEWHNRANRELDAVSPAALLQPAIDAFLQLENAFESLAPEELIRPAQTLISQLVGELRKIDLASIAAEVSAAIEKVTQMLKALAPNELLKPLIVGYKNMVAVVDQLDPQALVKPFQGLLDAVAAPLAQLSSEGARAVSLAFAPLAAASAAYDPQASFELAARRFAETSALLRQLDLGKLTAELKSAYDALIKAYGARAAEAPADLQPRLVAFNPLTNTILTEVTSGTLRLQEQLQSGFAGAQPPAELVARSAPFRAQLESLVPAWANPDLTPEARRAALQSAGPLGMVEQIENRLNSFKAQLQAFDPGALLGDLNVLYERIVASAAALNPLQLADGVRNALDNLTAKLDSLDLELVVNELQGLAGEIQTIIGGLDPRPIIAKLDGLVNTVKETLAGLAPAEVLAEIKGLFDQVHALVHAFHPQIFIDALQGVFQEIQATLAAIDLGKLTKPLLDRLHALRDELETALKRTETAFEAMVSAIPL